MRLDMKAVYGGHSSVGRALDCDSSGRGFEPHRPPHCSRYLGVYIEHQGIGPLAQLVEQWTLNPFVVGSTPTWPTNKHLKILVFSDAPPGTHNHEV